MPSSSARCAQLPRASDKVPFFLALRKYRDYLKGEIANLEDSELIFTNVDMRHKSELKYEKIETSECAAELTPEQIIMRSEYLDALEATAEGREIHVQKIEKNFRKRFKQGATAGSDEEDNAITFEDEESSQSSNSSEVQKGTQNSDVNNSISMSSSSGYIGGYGYLGNSVGSSPYEMLSSFIKEEINPYDGQDSLASPAKSDDFRSSLDSPRGTSSPMLLSHYSPLASPQSSSARSSPQYTNLGPPCKTNSINTNNIGKQTTFSPKRSNSASPSSWQHSQQQPVPSHPAAYPNNPAMPSEITSNNVKSSTYSNLSSSSMYNPQGETLTQNPYYSPNHGVNSSNYSNPGVKSPYQSSTIAYYPNTGSGQNVPYHQMPTMNSAMSVTNPNHPMTNHSQTMPNGIPSSSPSLSSPHQYNSYMNKMNRPPFPPQLYGSQWSSSSKPGSITMPPPFAVPQNSPYPYYNRHFQPSGPPSTVSANPSSSSSAYKTMPMSNNSGTNNINSTSSASNSTMAPQDNQTSDLSTLNGSIEKINRQAAPASNNETSSYFAI